MCAVAPDRDVRRARRVLRRRIMTGEERSPAGLARNCGQLRVSVARRVVGRLHAGCARAAVGVSDEDAPLLVNVYADEVEQIAMHGRAAAAMYAPTLDGIVRRHINSLPRDAAVISCRNIEMIETGKRAVAAIARRGR